MLDKNKLFKGDIRSWDIFNTERATTPGSRSVKAVYILHRVGEGVFL